MKLAHVSLVLYLCVVALGASTEPQFGESSRTTFTSRGESLTFPTVQDDENITYFSDNINFNAIDGQILIGAADKLFTLDKSLNVLDGGVYTWTTTAQGTCTPNGNADQCRNHIRIYQRPRSDSNTLFVCGTQSGIEPQCRILNITGSSLIETGEPNATNLISAHPDLPGFGEFRQSNSMDNIYFAANYKSVDTASFDISYQQVEFSEDGESVSTSRLYGWQEGDDYWMNSPLTFVDYRRVDYLQPNAQYQYYFVFLREKEKISNTDDGEDVITRVLRLCRNDAGVMRQTPAAGTQDRIFTSFMKARIFCELEMPPGPQYVGAQDFKYNEMWSAAFNSPDGGRYHETTDYVHMVYGAFSGPRIGPVGTAICAYRADMGNPSSSEGLTGGIFDVFRDDLKIPSTGDEEENNYLLCAEEGRSVSSSQAIQAVQDVRQIGDNPLLVLDGFHTTQMIVDQVCVVRRSDNSTCVNQDVLFLGTSDGRVLKVVFATDVSGTGSILPIFPVIAEEIHLSDSNPVKELKLDVVGSSKQLYVVTQSKLYRLPLERCSRHGENFTACIGSRDPYCVWNSSQSSCVRSPLSATGSQQGAVPMHLQQNVHTANISLPRVWFERESYTATEGATTENRLMVTVVSDRPVPRGVVEVDIINGTAKVGVNVFSQDNPIPISLDQGSGNVATYRHTFRLETRRDNIYRGNLQFQLRLRNAVDGPGAALFTQRIANVTIIDTDVPRVWFERESYTATEGAATENRLMVTVVSDRPVPRGVVKVDIIDGTAKVGVNVFSQDNPIPISLDQSSGNMATYRHTFRLETRRDSIYRGNLQFQLRLRNAVDGPGAALFTQRIANVTIIDIDGTLFRVGFNGLSSLNCFQWTAVNKDASDLLSNEIAAAISGTTDKNYEKSNIVNVTLNCSNPTDKYITLIGALLTTSDLSTNDLSSALSQWIQKEEEIKSTFSESIQVDADCSVNITSRENATCQAVSQPGGVSPQVDQSSSSAIIGLAVAFVIVMVIAVTLVVAVVLLSCMLMGRKHNNSTYPSPKVTPKRTPDTAEYGNGKGNGYSEPHRPSLNERRGSRELQIDVDKDPTMSLMSATNPKSTEPLLGKVAFPFSDETDQEKSTLDDTVHNVGALDKSPSPEPTELPLKRDSVEFSQNISYETQVFNGSAVAEQTV